MTPRLELGYAHSMADTPYRTAIVTGASRGIGAATVRRLRELGLAVHAVARSVEPLQMLAKATGCIPVALDIADRAAVLAAPRRMDVSLMETVPTDQSYGGSHFHRRGPSSPDRRTP
jgi:nucleoside-diphosphate-sugar epimerase